MSKGTFSSRGTQFGDIMVHLAIGIIFQTGNINIQNTGVIQAQFGNDPSSIFTLTRF